MKRIFYNNMMKKLLVSLSLVVMLFAYVVPLRIFAATATAADLREMIDWEDGLNRTIDEKTCQNIINTIINADKDNNSVESTKKDGKVTKITFRVTNKTVVADAFNGIWNEVSGTDISNNVYAPSGLYVEEITIAQPPVEKPEDEEENPANNGNETTQNGDKTATADDIYEVFKNNQEWACTKNDCQNIIDNLVDYNSKNEVKYDYRTDGKKIIIFKAVSPSHVELSVNNALAGTNYGTAIVGGNVEFVKFEVETLSAEDRNSDPEYAALTDDEKKMVDQIYDQYIDEGIGMDLDIAIDIVTEGKYKTDENGNVDLDWDTNGAWYQDRGLKMPWKSDKDTGDLGGWLLEPIFMLVNFVFDSLTSHLGYIMNGSDGFLYTKTNPTVDTSALTYKDVVKVNVAPFGVTHVYHTVTYTPEQIFSGKIDLLSIDFISGTKADGTAITNEGWINIRTVIAQWYKVLRMIAIIGLLSVLIYTGIKIIISANAKDKAKYKEWILNWFIAVAILFTMHYLMAFITSVTGEFSNLLSEANGKVIVEEVDGEDQLDSQTVNKENLFETNLMGLVRFKIQTNNMGEKIAYEVMYIALFIYTVKFTFVYLKRVLNMAFLTLIAPIVALTYPIDKLNDGNAQGFNMWLKEYIFNALLQPMHLVLYYILLGSAIGVAANNPLYGIVVLAFMTQAEDLLKKIFGFNKAGVTMANGMTGAFAAGALAAGVKNLARLGGKGSGGNGDKDGGNNPAIDKPKPTEKDDKDMELFDDPANESESQDSNENNDSDENKSVEEKMFDADEENGAFDDDPEYREYLERGNNQQNDNNYSDEERREMLRDQGWSEEEIDEALNPTEENGEQQAQQENEQQNEQEAEPNTDPIDELAEEQERRRKERLEKRQARRSKFANGAKAVGKQLAKPVWEFGKGGKYNGKRLARKVGRVAVGAAIGITAAAVQAGISITDGKYNIGEGIATFAAGYAGGGKVAKGIGSIGSTFMEGYTAGDKKAAMAKAQERWGTRDDVIKHNQQKWASSEVRAQMEQRQREHYLPQGINDLSKMDKCFNYVDKIRSEERNKNLTDKQLDTKARIVSDFMDDLDAQGMKSAIRDADKRKKYIETITKGIKDDAERRKTANRYNNLFVEAAKFQDANRN